MENPLEEGAFCTLRQDEKIGDLLLVQPLSNIGEGSYGARGSRDCHTLGRSLVKKHALSNPIAGTEERATQVVPQDESEVAQQVARTVLPPGLIGSQDERRIRKLTAFPGDAQG